MVVVGRNNVPARGANALSVLHRFLNSDVNFVDYRAMLGTATLLPLLTPQVWPPSSVESCLSKRTPLSLIPFITTN